MDVLRISVTVSADVFAVVCERGVQPGPVLVNAPGHCVEVLVPPGTAATWPPLPHTVCVANALMRCPAPEVTRDRGRRTAGRTWTAPPGTSPETTSADALAEALPAALARAAARARGIAGWAGDSPAPGHPREGQHP
ncbi:hypothetical protein ACFY5F_29360 [Streptomyces sp. NPDC013161]|uniref:hypothetical protein n=1 Tax=Streptomyces sp. NPDC013161 TaxID=3364862 RepID=UPI0036A912F6